MLFAYFYFSAALSVFGTYFRLLFDPEYNAVCLLALFVGPFSASWHQFAPFNVIPSSIPVTLFTQQQAATSRRKRASNVTREMFANNFCSPRFILLEAGGARFGLFWDCPEGENSPPVSVQPLLCEALVQSGLVETCRGTNTSVFTRPTTPPSLPKIRCV